LKQKKRESRNRGQSRAARAAKLAPPEPGQCAACGASSAPQAMFCQRCGAALNEQSAAALTKSRRLPLLIVVAAVLGVVAATLMAMFVIEADRSASPPTVRSTAPAPPKSAAAIDLSTMTPREAADRLFNRVMGASERGDASEAARFAPMAVQAYARVAKLDADAHFHLGLLHLQLKDLNGTRAQIEKIRQQVPQHLLAYVLEHEVSARAGDEQAVARTAIEFAAAYEAENALARPEYEGHRVSIEQLRKPGAAPAQSAEISARPMSASDGAALFASNCAVCHGPDAVGTAQGPPLVHRIYEPSHHGDDAFYRAVREGVQSHHWKFGAMPPVAGVSDEQVGRIIVYVRALQRASGID
jgi:mono/diheme cytochrome c family protein